MSLELTPDESRGECIAAMGDELGNLFYELSNECTWLHLKWQQFVILYGTNPERVVLLNDIAPMFFGIVQECLWENVLLHLCRLTDPPKSAGKENLTLNLLPPLVTPVLAAHIELLIRGAAPKFDFARGWRNRRLAHYDRGLAMEEAANSLADASRRHVMEALSHIGEILNAVRSHYLDETAVYEFAIGQLGDADALVKFLRDTNDARSFRSQPEKSGVGID